MQKSKLIRLLSLFSTQELDDLLAFVKSPYFNTNRHLTTLLEYLAPFAPQFKDAALHSSNAYVFIFGTRSNTQQEKTTITKLSSKLLKLCEEYIAHQTLREQEFYAAHFRKKWFGKSHSPDWEEDALRKMQVAQAKYPLQDEFKSYMAYQVQYELAKWRSGQGMITEKFDLKTLNETLDSYYLRAKLECLCHMANHALVMGQPGIMQEQAVIGELLEARRSKMDPACLLWEKALLLLNEPQALARYEELKKGLETHAATLSLSENQAVFLYLSHAARLSFSDTDAYFKELMHLYQWQIRANTLLVEGYLNPVTFFNIISVAIRLKMIPWATSFFHQFVNKLEPSAEKSHDMRFLCLAMLHVEKKEYDPALELLNNTHFFDIQSKLAERRLRLKIYLALDYEATFLDQINTFRKFLSVNKNIIPPHHYTGNQTFIKAMLLLYKSQQGEKAVLELQRFVTENPALPDKIWFERRMGRSD